MQTPAFNIGSCQHARLRAFSRRCRIILKTVTFSLMFIFAAHKKLQASVIADNYHQQHAASNTFVITRQCIAPAKVATVSVETISLQQSLLVTEKNL